VRKRVNLYVVFEKIGSCRVQFRELGFVSAVKKAEGYFPVRAEYIYYFKNCAVAPLFLFVHRAEK
jgi:hypothetical protein